MRISAVSYAATNGFCVAAIPSGAVSRFAPLSVARQFYPFFVAQIPACATADANILSFVAVPALSRGFAALALCWSPSITTSASIPCHVMPQMPFRRINSAMTFILVLSPHQPFGAISSPMRLMTPHGRTGAWTMRQPCSLRILRWFDASVRS